MHGMPAVCLPPCGSYRHLLTRYDPLHSAFWLILDPKPLPCVSLELIEELRCFHSWMDLAFRDSDPADLPVRYFIAASNRPGVFNLGGDLSLFARCVADRDGETLRKYARGCIETFYPYINGFNLPLTTISLVQGDALGGGLEIAMGGDVLIAERSAKMGFPEVLFNLFPGMGAYNLLSRRIGMKETERMLLNGKTYRAAELHEQGVVDVLAEDGKGENAVYEFIVRNAERRNSREAIHRVRRRLFPIRYEELLDVTEIWVDAALGIGQREIRLMERLSRSQERLYRDAPVARIPSGGGFA